MTVRKKGGNKRVKKGRRKIEVIPVWREVPDARLYALAVLELVKQQAAALDKGRAGTKKLGADQGETTSE